MIALLIQTIFGISMEMVTIKTIQDIGSVPQCTVIDENQTEMCGGVQ